MADILKENLNKILNEFEDHEFVGGDSEKPADEGDLEVITEFQERVCAAFAKVLKDKSEISTSEKSGVASFTLELNAPSGDEAKQAFMTKVIEYLAKATNGVDTPHEDPRSRGLDEDSGIIHLKNASFGKLSFEISIQPEHEHVGIRFWNIRSKA